MKVGIVGAGKVGTACLFALALRGAAPPEPGSPAE